jgi:signal transduction histidine kinase
MRRDAWACFGLDAARALVALACTACLWALPAQLRAQVQIQQADYQIALGGSFGPVAAQPAALPDNWTRVSLPHTLPREPGQSGPADAIDTAWYRIEIPAASQAVAPGRLRLYVPRWQTIGQIAVYADQRLLYRSGAGPVWNGFNHPLWLPLDEPLSGARPAHVLVRVDHLRSAGLGLSTAWTGDERELAPRRWWREWLQSEVPYLTSAGLVVIGLFALGVWVRRREPAYGLLFAASVLLYARSLHYHLGLEPLPIPEDWFGWMTVSALAWLIPTTYFLGLRLHGQRHPRIEWPLLALIAVSTVAGLPPLAVVPSVALLAPLTYLAMLVALVAIVALGAWSAWRARSRDGLLVAATNALSVPAGVHDLMLQSYRVDIEHLYVLPYAAIMLFVVLLLVLLRRYLAAVRGSEQANVVLAQRLHEREAELGESHAKLRTIEREQVLAQERDRLMQDMHDGLGSSLMGALKAVEHGQALDLGQVLRDCIEDLNLDIDSLEPVQADLLLLLAALRFRLGSRLEQAGIRLQWEVQDVPPLPWLDPRSALHILRILQEVLGNAVRHSGAGRVTVATRLEGGTVLVTVDDDGKGFDPQAPGGRGRGLVHIRRRAEAIGAAAQWLARPQGMRFELAMPVAGVA